MGVKNLKHFEDARSFRGWLAENGRKAAELWVGFHRLETGKKSITYPEALDEALCQGWIDGVRKSLGQGVYTIRFTPRKAKSNWSIVNIRRVHELIKLKRMKPAGLRAFEARDESRTERYFYARKTSKFSRSQEKLFRQTVKAWKFFQSQPPWYRRASTWWVVSAAKTETRERRLAKLIEDSAAERRLGMMTSNKRSE
jgi:uncharacterized protein YdeI (YjbR/CyaY-like superfamily)